MDDEQKALYFLSSYKVTRNLLTSLTASNLAISILYTSAAIVVLLDADQILYFSLLKLLYFFPSIQKSSVCN